MKKINNYWVDENNNKWWCDNCTEEQAREYSDGLVNCRDCIGCRDCSDCRYCRYCSYCRGCIGCSDCRRCRDCNYCSYCSDCRRCRDCSDCRYCIGCNYCRGCVNFTTQPLVYTTKKIGSRDDNTVFYYDGVSDLQVVCGCFRGNLEEFEKAVRKTHENNEEYLNQYLKEIEKVKVLFELKEGE